MFDRVLSETISFVKATLAGAEAGHDWFHTERVWKLSLKIAAAEKADLQIVQLGALLHDIADPKFHGGDEQLALQLSQDFLTGQNISPEITDAILFIIKNISFKNRADLPADLPVELKIVQDADRLDAIGAIGIARTFNFGGFKNNLLYDPEKPPQLGMTKEEYKKSDGTTINHFYEKLLLLKDLMRTETAQKMAAERHDFMLGFLDQFYREWNASG